MRQGYLTSWFPLFLGVISPKNSEIASHSYLSVSSCLHRTEVKQAKHQQPLELKWLLNYHPFIIYPSHLQEGLWKLLNMWNESSFF